MGCCHVVLRIQEFRVKCLHLKDGGVWLPGRWKGKKPRFSFPTTRLKVRVRNQILGDCLRNPFSSYALELEKKLFEVGWGQEEGLIFIYSQAGNSVPKSGEGDPLDTLLSFLLGFRVAPLFLPSAPPPAGEGGSRPGAGPHQPRLPSP